MQAYHRALASRTRACFFFSAPSQPISRCHMAHGRCTRSNLLICVGGNGRSAGFSRAVASKRSRSRFIAALVRLCENLGLDGVDYNWEYPGYHFGSGYASEDAVARDYQGLIALLRETSAAFAPSGRRVTLAYYPDGRQEHLLAKGRAAKYVDAMHMMTYDQAGKHSTMELAQKSAEQAVRHLLPVEKLTLGLPFLRPESTHGRLEEL